jgi:hypothetical protein
MNIEHLRQTLKSEWLNYYRQNRDWIVRLSIWVNYEDQRRPSASFMLGALATMEPQLSQLLPLVVDLNSNPDRIIKALGLNFNPETELEALEAAPVEQTVKMLPSNLHRVELPQPQPKPLEQQIEYQSIQPEPAQFKLSQPNPFESNPSQPNPSQLNPPQPERPPGFKPVTPSPIQPAPANIQANSQPDAQPDESLPLDTAQLKTHEQPRSARRSRQQSRWD